MELNNIKLMAATLEGIQFGKKAFFDKESLLVERSHIEDVLDGRLRIELWNNEGFIQETVVFSKEELEHFWNGFRSIVSYEIKVVNEKCSFEMKEDGLRYRYHSRHPWHNKVDTPYRGDAFKRFDYSGIVVMENYPRIVKNDHCIRMTAYGKILLEQFVNAVNL